MIPTTNFVLFRRRHCRLHLSTSAWCNLVDSDGNDKSYSYYRGEVLPWWQPPDSCSKKGGTGTFAIRTRGAGFMTACQARVTAFMGTPPPPVPVCSTMSNVTSPREPAPRDLCYGGGDKMFQYDAANNKFTPAAPGTLGNFSDANVSNAVHVVMVNLTLIPLEQQQASSLRRG